MKAWPWMPLFALVAILALTGATTWTQTQTTSVRGDNDSDASVEGDSAPETPTAGLSLTAGDGIGAFSVTVEKVSGNVPAGGYLRCFIFNPEGKWPDGGVGGGWAAAPELDLGPTVGGFPSETWSGFEVLAPYPGSRIAFRPDGLQGPTRVYINGTRMAH